MIPSATGVRFVPHRPRTQSPTSTLTHGPNLPNGFVTAVEFHSVDGVLPREVRDLRRRLDEAFPSFPTGLQRAAPHNATTAFFPGGHGLWGIGERKSIVWPRGGVMIVGNDFGRAIGDAGELGGPTWRPLVGTGDPPGI